MPSSVRSGRPTRDFFERPTDVVARELLGCLLTVRRAGAVASGRIVEVEAYGGPTDPASHSAMYKSERVRIMSTTGGLVYTYRSYGVHTCFNIVAKPPGETGAVLIRAMQPIEGMDAMRRRRGTADVRLLCSGPGRLCQALELTLDDHGRDLVDDPDVALELGAAPGVIASGPRIGITKEIDRPWRFWDADSIFVSRRSAVGGRRRTAQGALAG